MTVKFPGCSVDEFHVSVAPTNESNRHFSGIAVRIVVSFVKERFGAEILKEILDRAGESKGETDLCDDAAWYPYEQVRSLLEATATVLGGAHWLTAAASEAPIGTGSGAEITQTLQDMGSPGALLRLVVDADAAFGLCTIRTAEGDEMGPTEWVVRERFHLGFEPFKEFCYLTAGMLMMLPRLFGLPAGEVVEEHCCCDGAAFCSFRLCWRSEGDVLQERNYLETRTQLLEARLTNLQHTVGELVAASNPNEGLSGILMSAARAVHAPSYVLVREPGELTPRQIHSVGLDAEEAERIGDELPNQVDQDILGRIVVKVSSTRSRYGWLAAIEPGNRRFLPQERELVRSYADLAAAALDASATLEESRRNARTAETLLELSRSLAELVSTEEMAQNLARAVSSVVDCDQALVILVDPVTNKFHVVAADGYPEGVQEQLRGMSLRKLDMSMRMSEVTYFERPQIEDLTAIYGLHLDEDFVAAASVHLIANGELIGDLVVSVTEGPDRLRKHGALNAVLRGLASQAAIAIRNARLVDEMRHQALHDELTGLPNRTLILDCVQRALARARREEHPVAVFFIDLDGFKEINDTFGHTIGDRLLSAAALRLGSALRSSDSIGRFGGDEFVAVIEGASFLTGPEFVAHRMLELMRKPFDVEIGSASPLCVTASIGIAFGDRRSAGDLLRNADIALYEAKNSGKNRYVVFHPDMAPFAGRSVSAVVSPTTDRPYGPRISEGSRDRTCETGESLALAGEPSATSPTYPPSTAHINN